MLVQPILSLITRMIPEAFLVMFSIYLLTNTKMDMKKIIISGIIGGIGVYVIRLLPIHFGVHTILAVMMYIFLAVKLNKIEIYKAIAITLVSQIILFISDFTFVLIYTKIFRLSSEAIFGHVWVAAVAGIPPLFLYYFVIRLIAYFKNKKVNNEQH